MLITGAYGDTWSRYGDSSKCMLHYAAQISDLSIGFSRLMPMTSMYVVLLRRTFRSPMTVCDLTAKIAV